MGDLYLDISTEGDDGYCRLSVYSAVTLFVFKFCQVDHRLKLTLHFVTMPSAARFPVKLRCDAFSSCFHRIHFEELPGFVQCCELPVIACSEQKLIISGLCSVLRYIVQTAQTCVESSVNCDLVDCVKNLLGQRQNCLRACAEVSEWTLYTEVTLPQLLERILNNSDIEADPPAELVQLENQLGKLPAEPSRLRNRTQGMAKQPSDAAGFTKRATDNVIKQESRSGGNINKLYGARKDQTCVDLVSDKFDDTVKRFETLQVAENAEEIRGRRFVEGSNVQLTDLIVFVCIQLIFSRKDTGQLCLHLPRIVSWYQRMCAVPNITNAVHSAGLFEYQSVADNLAQGTSCTVLSVEANSDMSVKSPEDESRLTCTSGGCNSTSVSVHAKTAAADDTNCIQHADKTKFRASQHLVDAGIAMAAEMGLIPTVLPLGSGRCLQLPWEQYPSWILPCGLGGVPGKRATRKLQQLENMVAAVQKLVSERSVSSAADVIVDFCSGGGHVGILLAYLFPHSKVMLVENKEESVRRAVERIARSTADNVTVVQCNLGRFQAPFDIGICLHACGVAADLVLAKCIAASACFVVAPCCYGSIRNGHLIQYPRSHIFQSAGLEYSEYLALGHAADQTEATIAKSGQGRACMAIVDCDRCRLAEQFGYTTELFVMTPPTCSPKNHILTGWPASSNNVTID